MLRKLLEKIERFRFERIITQIVKTEPITYIYNDKVKIVSMVGHNSLFMYLLAIKTFMSNFGYGSIVAINDGSLTNDDLDILHEHIANLTIVNANDFDTHGCPSYISWKRLFCVASLVKDSYVIQLDSDIVVNGPLSEISDKVEQNSGFVIGSGKWSEPVSTYFLHSIVKQWNNDHVQPSAEQHYKDLAFFQPNLKYLRGCAGFAGYPKNSFTIEQITQLSHEIEQKIGRKKWQGWGSEQTATLCLISQSNNASILPWPKYHNYGFPITNEPVNSTTLSHFIGSNRFKGSTYRKLAKAFIHANSKK
ncbi:hypothetical protein [Vibrio sp. MA40-2]|uniref:hypothetical protein n=1 Tax=Vibrio sp. MA40-2 TaxID=3391828 RepID=UPI0039A5988E